MKKFTFKNLLLTVMSAALLVALAGCSLFGGQQVVYKPANPYWLSSASFGNVVDRSAYEKCSYELSYKEAATPNADVAVSYLPESSYTTELKADKYNDADCYLLTVTYDVRGTYTTKADGKTYDFTDLSVSRTYFTWDSGIKFLCSEENAQTTLPEKTDGGYDFEKIAYTAKIVYSGNKAQTEFHITEGKPSSFAGKDGATASIKNYNNGNYLDKNVMIFAVRSFDFAEGLNYSFGTVDVLSNSKRSMIFAAAGAATTVNVVNLKHNGVVGEYGLRDDTGTIFTVSAQMYTVNMNLNETYRGTNISATYFEDSERYRHYMYSLTTDLPYGLGRLTYTLTDVTDRI